MKATVETEYIIKYLSKKNCLLFITFLQTEVMHARKVNITLKFYMLPCWRTCYVRTDSFPVTIFCSLHLFSRISYKLNDIGQYKS